MCSIAVVYQFVFYRTQYFAHILSSMLVVLVQWLNRSYGICFESFLFNCGFHCSVYFLKTSIGVLVSKPNSLVLLDAK